MDFRKTLWTTTTLKAEIWRNGRKIRFEARMRCFGTGLAWDPGYDRLMVDEILYLQFTERNWVRGGVVRCTASCFNFAVLVKLRCSFFAYALNLWYEVLFALCTCGIGHFLIPES